jgi:hypothetical protein
VYAFVGKGPVFTPSDTNISLSGGLYGIKPMIPDRSNRKKPIRQDTLAYKGRDFINRGYSWLNGFRPVVTRSDKLARDSFSTVAAVFPFWLYLIESGPLLVARFDESEGIMQFASLTAISEGGDHRCEEYCRKRAER